MAILLESAGQTDRLTPPVGFIRARLDVKACLIHFHSHAEHNTAQCLSLDGTQAETQAQSLKQEDKTPGGWPLSASSEEAPGANFVLLVVSARTDGRGVFQLWIDGCQSPSAQLTCP